MPGLDDDDDDLDDEIQAPSFSPMSCASESTPSEPIIGHESDTDKSLQSEMVYMHVILIYYYNYVGEHGNEWPTCSICYMWFGYKFVGDNIDKNVKPRFQ